MKIGLVITTPPDQIGNIHELFASIKAMGFEGIGFRSLLQLSQTLDPGELDTARQDADRHGLFLDFGLGWVNPYNALTKPEIWALGEGDYCHALQRQLLAARAMGCKEIVGEIAGVKGPYAGRYAFDRFRTDVGWNEQLRASRNLLMKIRPVLEEIGMRINLENHEDLTTHELLRMVDEIEPDHLGFSLDVANLVVMGEDPVAGSRRLAPHVHLAHIKDVFLLPTEKGFLRQIRPAGQGVIDWEAILPEVYRFDTNIHLLVEDHKGMIQIDVWDSAWRAHYPELIEEEVSSLVKLAERSEQRVQVGEIDPPASYESIPYMHQRLKRLSASLAYLQSLREECGLWDSPI